MVHLNKLLGFDPYAPLKSVVISELKSKNPIDSEFFAAIEKKIGKEYMKQILEIDTVHVSDDSLYEEWRRQLNEAVTTDRLVEQLDKYSVFQGRELICI